MIRALIAAATAVALLTGCSANDPLAAQYKAGDNKNYIAGDGTVTEFAKSNRGAAVKWSGISATGEELSSRSLAGVVTVMNFWYAGCAPCRAEAPDLVALQAEFGNVQFIGVNVRDSAETSMAFEKNFDITWPSVIDAKTGSVLLAFTGIVTPQAVPTTIVIGKDGKVTSRVLGRIDKSILRTLIKTAVNE
ncbi:TlpA family protein disulfide reductase [Rhodoluna lacicola]|uniref:TlpA family protein disulfide reductase n=1 Tax=Rhodoluna lacicola TaxID=529884 RepID=UPI00222FD395|nr:TlpA disulfide reductase family protein [Rhodoluna lacicola]BDS49930.1 thiol-disulfide isomerase [Rhodoluna lacicola]